MKRFTLLLLAAALCTSGLTAETPAAPRPFDGFTPVKTVGAITEYTLDANGLQVLLMPEHSAPVITFMVTYRVGSRNEVTGTTGATHLLEHLMFKGSKNFNKQSGGTLDQVLDPIGGVNNATTSIDRTNYYEIFGKDHLALVVEMEADRMRGLLLREEDRQPEMTVVRNEFERGENSPVSSLRKEIVQAAYVAHPYHHSTIGWRSDIEKVSIQKLREFYDTFYWPDNATVTIVGDFKTDEALALVKKLYAPIPRAPNPIPQVYTEEPEQTGLRRVVVQRAGQLGVVMIGHKAPPALHTDAAALDVMSTILADGKGSRLYKAITDQSLSTGASAGAWGTRDPFLHFTTLPLAPGVEHQKVEAIALAEIEKLKADGVTDAEVKTAIAKLLASTAFQRDGSFNIAANINEAIAVGDWTFYYTYGEQVQKVTASEVQRVAQKYLNADQSTTGWFIPKINAPAAAQN